MTDFLEEVAFKIGSLFRGDLERSSVSAENTIDENLRNSGSFLILYWPNFHPFGKVVDKRDNIAVPFCRYWMRTGEIDSHSFPRLSRYHRLKLTLMLWTWSFEACATLAETYSESDIPGPSWRVESLLDFPKRSSDSKVTAVMSGVIAIVLRS